MTRTPTLKSALDDALQIVRVDSFHGGLHSDADPLDLELNESPDCQNVKISKTGAVIGRQGFYQMSSTAANADGIAFLYDDNGNTAMALWANGNLYRVILSIPVLTAAAVYTAGRRIAHTTLNNILYYSDGLVPLRQWDPATGIEQAVANTSTAAGNVNPPAANVLCTYNGAILAGNCITTGVLEPSGLRWSDTNNPNSWIGTNIYQVGQGQGGYINSMVPFGISSVGVSPFKALFVGKSQNGCYALSGPLSGLSEALLNITAGVRDGATVKYVPGPSGGGAVMFLGTDFSVWYTNGVESGQISQKFQQELSDYLTYVLTLNNRQKFTAALNSQDNQYILDVGLNRQYVYDYGHKAWTRYAGWTSGYWCQAVDSVGAPQLWVADTTNAKLNLIGGTTDNGTAIAPYWNTPYIHGGSPTQWKSWKFVVVEYATDNTGLGVYSIVNNAAGDFDYVTIDAPGVAVTDGGLDWTIDDWDEANWGTTSLPTAYTVYTKRTRLAHANTNLPSNSLQGQNNQLRITQTTSGQHFELHSLELQFISRGKQQVGR
jgi:hypothetical protein